MTTYATPAANYGKHGSIHLGDDVRFAVAGDWHGRGTWAIMALKAISQAGIHTVYHVGDFGIWPGREGQKYLRALNRQAALYDQVIYVTLGNHEDYTQANSTPVSDDGLQWITERIAIMPRGFRWDIAGKSCVSFGGAASLDFEDRREGIDWWKEEAITMGDVYRLAEAGPADIMISHDAPNGIDSLKFLKRDTNKISEKAIAYSNESRKLMDAAVSIVQPSLLFHGHYHTYHDETVEFDGFSSRVIGLNRDLFQNNVSAFNLETMESTMLQVSSWESR